MASIRDYWQSVLLLGSKLAPLVWCSGPFDVHHEQVRQEIRRSFRLAMSHIGVHPLSTMHPLSKLHSLSSLHRGTSSVLHKMHQKSYTSLGSSM